MNASLANPYSNREDLATGRTLFSGRCTGCHGADGRGSLGPSLARFGYKNGDSDLAIYRTLTDGLVGTVMEPTHLSFAERWQVVHYLRTLQLHSDHDEDGSPPSSLNIQASIERISNADSSGEWLSYSGSMSGWRYSRLSEITPTNVSQLRLRWVHQFGTSEPKIESTPLVVNDIIFITEPPATVVALDSSSGKVIWQYVRPIPVDLPLCCGRINRGLAILDSSLFFGSLDGFLVAINAKTGKVIWQTEVAKPADGFSLTGAPLVVNHSVVIGVAGGDFGVRGFLAAYDVTTGQLQWKFDTIPGPGELGHETWQNEAWQTGGGATWGTGSYDPSLDLLYWGIGNAAPVFNGDIRPGDNLFTNSVVALRASTGKLAWYFQFSPHDTHNWDSTQTPILADLRVDGLPRKVICWPNRNGFYYVLDRVTGQFLVGTPFAEIDWAQGLTPAGRPVPRNADTAVTGGRLTKPSVFGATGWQPAAFNPAQGLVYVSAVESQSVFTKSAASMISRDKGHQFLGSAGSFVRPFTTVVRALDAATGAKRWDYRSPPATAFSGLLATAGGLVFGTSGGYLFALDAVTGKELWRVSLGGDTHAPPISFTSKRQQVIAVSAGRDLFLFGL